MRWCNGTVDCACASYDACEMHNALLKSQSADWKTMKQVTKNETGKDEDEAQEQERRLAERERLENKPEDEDDFFWLEC